MRIPSFLLTVLSLGLQPSTALSQTTRQPVISRVDILFSLVSHYNHLADKIDFYNNIGSPPGNTNYAVPHLVYEPTVTLYNPYNEPLTMIRSRIKISDPPVGFAFKKNDVYLRPDFATGNFHGLSRFQISNEFNPSARKSFTLSLSSPTATGTPGDSIVLQPGESKTFATWVEKDWTWGMETAGGYNPRSFHDWNANNDFTNRDPRTSNAFGVEAVSTIVPFSFFGDPRAGFQADWLSHSSGVRPLTSLYSFENPARKGDGSVAIKTTDTINVQVKSMRTNPVADGPDFQVDLLRGEVQDPESDRVKAFPMSLDGITQNNERPVISRTFRVGQILQVPADKSLGGKTSFAAITMVAKSSALRANQFYATPAVPTRDLYELQFMELLDYGITPNPASDSPFGAPPQVYGVSRIGNTLFIDFSGGADVFGTKTWKVRGTSSLEAGFTDDLGSVATVNNSMSASGIYKAIIDVSNLGERYFVRIEE